MKISSGIEGERSRDRIEVLLRFIQLSCLYIQLSCVRKKKNLVYLYICIYMHICVCIDICIDILIYRRDIEYSSFLPNKKWDVNQ